MSFKSLRLMCFASGDNFYSYGVTTRPDDTGRVDCPSCGKLVKLRAGQPGLRRFIPNHNRAPELPASVCVLASEG